MPGTVAAEGPTVSLSFANNFWGKEDAGVTPLFERMHNAKVTGDELKAFYTARAQIEDDYSRKLLNLSRKPLGSSEAGTLRMSLDVIRGELETMGKEHQHVAGKLKSELEEPLVAFASGLKERRKIVQTGIEKLLKVKTQQTTTVNKARDRFEQDCLKIKGYLAQGHMVMGQEERKNKAKLEKTQVQMSANSNEYETAVKILEETTGKWNREWKAACDKFQDLEEERIDYFKSSLWNFANIASTVCVSDDGSCEKIRLSLEDCEVEKDITNFIKESGTGQEIPDPPRYINFCRGDVDDTMSKAESDDGEYSVAQFQRTMNPAFRSSSPNPSSYGSHHDLDSSLRDELVFPKSRTSVQGDDAFNARSSLGSVALPPPIDSFNGRSSHGSGVMPPGLDTFNPRSSHGSAAMPPPLDTFNGRSSRGSATVPPPLAPSQASAGADPYANAPQVPHNPFPSDGMTQFCRIGPPSERSSVPSPIRPDSRDSQEHSDYSAPTSFSSFEPTSGQGSPTKQYNGSNISGMSSGAEDPQGQKKKGNFFQSHSPFRRRSNKSKEPPQSASVTPSQRNNWTPATARKAESANTSPTRPFGAGGRASTWQKQPSPSPEPEPVDPRADYQLNIGNNVFDVASPDKHGKPSPKREASADADPIAQALAELKGVTKQASVRQPVNSHYGTSRSGPGTPTYDGRGMPVGGAPSPFASNGVRGAPPPTYEQPAVSRLGAPQPAHTRKEMQKTTERFVNQKRDMYNNGPAARPGSSLGRGPNAPRAASPQPLRSASPQPLRAASPQPLRATSPRPYGNSGQPQPQPQQQPYRAASPDPYGGAPPGSAAAAAAAAAAANNRPRAQSSSPIKQHQPGYTAYGGSPNYQNPAPRATSPNPGAYNRGPAGGAGSRPPSSRGGSDMSGGGGTGGGNAMVLAPAGDPYGSQRRPQSQYQPAEPAYGGAQQVASRTRSQSAGTQRQYTKDGRPILHYARAMYMYQAAIPEELSFGKGDVLAVIRHQDDGWWEAESCGKNGPPGLVPSNYLKQC